MVFRSQDLGCRCAYCSGVPLLSGLAGTELGVNVCVCNNTTCVHMSKESFQASSTHRLDSPCQATVTTLIPTHGHPLMWASHPSMPSYPAWAFHVQTSCRPACTNDDHSHILPAPTTGVFLALLQAYSPMWSWAESCHSLGLRGKERAWGRLFQVLGTCVHIYCHIAIIKFIYLQKL